jgi:hypothetical protein
VGIPVSLAPDARVRNGLPRRPDGPLTRVETPTGSKHEPIARDAVPAILEQRFGLREPEPEG